MIYLKYDHAFFDAGVSRVGTRSVKWDDPAHCRPGDLPLWVADWDFRCAEPIVQALKDRAAHPCYGYPCSDPADQTAFCDYWQRRHQLAIRPDQTVLMPCVVTGIRQAVLTFTQPGDSVLIMTPLYPPFSDSIRRSERKIWDVPLHKQADARYDIDFQGVEDALKRGVRMILFCNPHNPVSRAWRREELARLVALANAYGALLVSDEIHADFVYKPLKFISMLSIPGAKDCTLMFTAASKTFNVPGLQQATAVSFNKDLLKRFSDHMEMQGVVSGNVFALPATQAAYTSCDDWLDGMLSYLEESRKILFDALKEKLPEAVLSPIEATALSWIDLSAYDPDSESINQKLRSHRVVLNPGTIFGRENGNGFMRLNFACPQASLLEGVDRMSRALTK
ncbi:MAG: PatB family C-S lyase [Clostridia bacterium]|nr:PatB family C-S lyase [Clostridia bacterium]